jgi:hypothetical protein
MSLIVPSSKTEAGQQHLAQFNKKTTKIAQLEHRKIHSTSALLCGQDKKCLQKKKTWPLIPCRLSPPPLAVADGTDIGTIMAFVGGWFEFKSGYLTMFRKKI